MSCPGQNYHRFTDYVQTLEEVRECHHLTGRDDFLLKVTTTNLVDLEALIEARKRGQVRFIGFTGHKDPQIHLAMLAEADRHGFEFDTVQMPLNVMDAHYNSFEANVLPVLLQKRIGVLGMKSMGSGDILDSKIVQPAECLRYALSLPTSVVISGMDSERVLDENLQTARNFSPLSSEERSALLARTEDAAREGKHELFKTSHKYDGTIQNPKWLEQAAL